MTAATFDVDDLQKLELFSGLPADQLAWVARHGERVEVPQGQRLVNRGDPADYMLVVVYGTIQRYEEIGGQWLLVASTGPGQVTGMLPFSRMTHYPGHMVASDTAGVLRLHQSNFVEMLAVSTELGQRLVARMSDRVRGDVRLEQQRDKVQALGRLSAGLAHELNNPSAAAGRAAASLGRDLQALRRVVSSLLRHRPAETVVAAIEELDRAAQAGSAGELTPFERSDREDALTDWLEARDVPEAWDLGSALVDAGLSVDDIERFASAVPAAVAPAAVAWVGCNCSAARLAQEITASTQRVSQLLASVKTYSHMDRSSEHKDTDVRQGLDDTIVMLGQRLKAGGVRLTRRYAEDLPTLPGNAGELNQVWTHLIDNALDALGQNGHLMLTAQTDGPWVCVEVIDDGPGVPADIRDRIFEPFFTTKDVGAGTGLGLDIAQRIVTTHQGQIEMQSVPGRTTFRVRLPTTRDLPI